MTTVLQTCFSFKTHVSLPISIASSYYSPRESVTSSNSDWWNTLILRIPESIGQVQICICMSDQAYRDRERFEKPAHGSHCSLSGLQRFPS